MLERKNNGENQQKNSEKTNREIVEKKWLAVQTSSYKS